MSNKKNKSQLFAKIMWGVLAGLMVLMPCATLIFYLIVG